MKTYKNDQCAPRGFLRRRTPNCGRVKTLPYGNAPQSALTAVSPLKARKPRDYRDFQRSTYSAGASPRPTKLSQFDFYKKHFAL